jgi:hypothetical protein
MTAGRLVDDARCSNVVDEAAVHVGEDPLLPAYRILLRIAREKRAQKREEPPCKEKVALAPPRATSSSNTTMTVTRRSRLEDGHAS